MTERNDFLRYTQRAAAFVPGTNGAALRGYEGSAAGFGTYRSHTINGFAIVALTADSVTVDMKLPQSAQIPGKARVELWFLGASNLLINPILMNWNGTAYSVANAELFGFLNANLGRALKTRLVAKVS